MTKQIANPGGAFGLAADFGVVAFPFLSAETSTTISKGEVVSTTTSGKILRATTTVDPKLIVGVALEDIAAGDVGLIAVSGVVKNVKAPGGVAVGDLLERSSVVAGAVAAFTPTAVTDIGRAIGVAITISAGNLVDMMVGKV